MKERKEMILEKGYYKDSDDQVWYWDGWSNQPIVPLKTVQTQTQAQEDKYLGFSRDGNSIGTDDFTVIIKYLPEDEYPEYYI